MRNSFLNFHTQSLFLRSVRQYSSGIDKNALKELRNRTGIALSNCKKALDKFNNNLDEAEKWLKEQAQKEGWVRVAKLQNRPMSQGLVAMISKPGTATLIEVNCETDFVAKNQKFQEMVARLATSCHNHFQIKNENASYNKTEINALTEGSQTLADIIAVEVGTIGENIQLRRGSYHKASEDTFLSTYIHSSGPKIEIGDVQMGKYATSVEVSPVPMATDPDEDFKKLQKKQEETTEIEDQNINAATPEELSSDSDSDTEEEAISIEKIGKQLCLHVVGSAPSSVGIPGETTPSKTRNEEKTLLYQDLLSDDSVTVGNYLYLNGYSVNKFIRMECGEEIPGEDNSS